MCPFNFSSVDIIFLSQGKQNVYFFNIQAYKQFSKQISSMFIPDDF